jgi:hypothetical protein
VVGEVLDVVLVAAEAEVEDVVVAATRGTAPRPTLPPLMEKLHFTPAVRTAQGAENSAWTACGKDRLTMHGMTTKTAHTDGSLKLGMWWWMSLKWRQAL